MMWAFMCQHKPIPSNLMEFERQQRERHGDEKWKELKHTFLKVMAKNPHSSVLEFVNTVWYIEGASRALQQQLTRTRQAAYSIQSLRVVDCSSFADNQDYHLPPKLTPEQRGKFSEAMEVIQDLYGDMKIDGAGAEDARGILPLNITSPITMAINLRALSHFIEVRLCFLAQEEIQQMGQQMVLQVVNMMGSEYSALFDLPCNKLGRCPMPVICKEMSESGRYQLDEIYQNPDMANWLNEHEVKPGHKPGVQP